MDRLVDRRTFLITGLGVTGAVVLGACTGSKSDSGSTDETSSQRPGLRLGAISGDWGLPTPFTHQALPGYLRTSLVYDTLLWADSTGEMLPWLAQGFERSDDGMVYTFELRKGVTWHDGMPFTAEDVKFTFDYYATLQLPFTVVGQPQNVAGVRVTGDSSVEIRLEQPAVTFPVLVAGGVPIVPRHIWKSVPNPLAVHDPKLVVGTGAYRLDSYSAADGTYSFTSYDDYFLGQPFVQRIEFPAVGNELTALQAGDIDAAQTPNSGVRDDVLAPFQDKSSYDMIEDKAGFAYPLYFNAAKGGPLADVRFRQAFAHAVDRDAIVERLFSGNGAPGSPGFIPPGHPFFSGPEQYPYDVDVANQLLDVAGFAREGEATRVGPDGPVKLGLLFQAEASALIDLLVPALADIGVELVSESTDGPGGLFPRKLSKDYDLVLLFFPGPVGPGPGGDPDYLRLIFASSPMPTFFTPDGFSSPELDKLAGQQLVTADADERAGLLGQMQDIIAEQVVVLPLYYADQFFIFRPDVFDQWYFTPTDFPSAAAYNKQAFITGNMTGTKIGST
ncbi:MAG: ABC transporter substrate-binding protein [Marmoricola sp.]